MRILPDAGGGRRHLANAAEVQNRNMLSKGLRSSRRFADGTAGEMGGFWVMGLTDRGIERLVVAFFGQ